MTDYQLRIRQAHPAEFAEAVERAAAARRNSGDARTIRAVGEHWHAWALRHAITPLAPHRSDLDRFVAASPTRSPNKLRWALRTIFASADVAAEDHGLGIGVQRARLEQIEDSSLRELVRRVIDSGGHRTGVWRSGLAKLVAWTEASGIHPLDVTAPDLDDYLEWIRQVGGAEEELMVIARRFVEMRWQLLLDRV
jgi:hypothetical protein